MENAWCVVFHCNWCYGKIIQEQRGITLSCSISSAPAAAVMQKRSHSFDRIGINRKIFAVDKGCVVCARARDSSYIDWLVYF